MPKALEGPPGRGDGPESHPGGGGGGRLGGGKGPHAGVGQWRCGKGRSLRGTAAASRTQCDRERATGLPPPPPLGWDSVHGPGKHRAPLNRGATGVGSAAPRGDRMPMEADADP